MFPLAGVADTSRWTVLTVIGKDSKNCQEKEKEQNPSELVTLAYISGHRRKSSNVYKVE